MVSPQNTMEPPEQHSRMDQGDVAASFPVVTTTSGGEVENWLQEVFSCSTGRPESAVMSMYSMKISAVTPESEKDSIIPSVARRSIRHRGKGVKQDDFLFAEAAAGSNHPLNEERTAEEKQPEA